MAVLCCAVLAHKAGLQQRWLGKISPAALAPPAAAEVTSKSGHARSMPTPLVKEFGAHPIMPRQQVMLDATTLQACPPTSCYRVFARIGGLSSALMGLPTHSARHELAAEHLRADARSAGRSAPAGAIF